MTDTKSYRIKIKTRPKAKIIYKNQAGSFQQLQEEWIDINPDVKQLQFYATLPGFAEINIKRLGFSYDNDSFITADQFNNNTIDEVPQMKFISKTRGILNYRVFNRWGVETGADSFFVDQDT